MVLFDSLARHLVQVILTMIDARASTPPSALGKVSPLIPSRSRLPQLLRDRRPIECVQACWSHQHFCFSAPSESLVRRHGGSSSNPVSNVSIRYASAVVPPTSIQSRNPENVVTVFLHATTRTVGSTEETDCGTFHPQQPPRSKFASDRESGMAVQPTERDFSRNVSISRCLPSRSFIVCLECCR